MQKWKKPKRFLNFLNLKLQKSINSRLDCLSYHKVSTQRLEMKIFAAKIIEEPVLAPTILNEHSASFEKKTRQITIVKEDLTGLHPCLFYKQSIKT